MLRWLKENHEDGTLYDTIGNVSVFFIFVSGIIAFSIVIAGAVQALRVQ